MMRVICNFLVIVMTVVMLLNANAVYDTILPDEIIVKKQLTYEDLNSTTQKQVKCLADNIYYEARGESDDGKKAVAYTTLNRLDDGRWSDSICGVVKQKIRGTCQFSWMCDIRLLKHKKDTQLYEKCKIVAVMVYLNYVPGQNDITQSSTFYHAKSINPNWKNVTFVKDIGNHRFYRLNNS